LYAANPIANNPMEATMIYRAIIKPLKKDKIKYPIPNSIEIKINLMSKVS
jgi:hypothetical protein